MALPGRSFTVQLQANGPGRFSALCRRSFGHSLSLCTCRTGCNVGLLRSLGFSHSGRLSLAFRGNMVPMVQLQTSGSRRVFELRHQGLSHRMSTRTCRAGNAAGLCVHNGSLHSGHISHVSWYNRRRMDLGASLRATSGLLATV